MMIRFLMSIIAVASAALIAFSCSRKADDELPPRVGNLRVLFRIDDQFGILPDTNNIPVLVSIYTDTTHARMVRSEAITARNHVITQVDFEEMESAFFSLSLLINVPGLPPPCPDLKVFVVLDQLTTTSVLEVEVRAQELRCNY